MLSRTASDAAAAAAACRLCHFIFLFSMQTGNADGDAFRAPSFPFPRPASAESGAANGIRNNKMERRRHFVARYGDSRPLQVDVWRRGSDGLGRTIGIFVLVYLSRETRYS